MYHCILLDLKLRRKSALRKSPHSNSSCSCIKEIFNLLHSSDCMISCNRVRLIPFRFFSFPHLHATKEISSMRTPITVTVYISNSSLWMCSSKFQGNWQIVFGFLDNQKFLFRGLRVVSRQALRRKLDCVTLQCWNSNLRLWLRRFTSIILSKLALETIEISNQMIVFTNPENYSTSVKFSTQRLIPPSSSDLTIPKFFSPCWFLRVGEAFQFLAGSCCQKRIQTIFFPDSSLA